VQQKQQRLWSHPGRRCSCPASTWLSSGSTRSCLLWKGSSLLMARG
jgi:hypothetical protein